MSTDLIERDWLTADDLTLLHYAAGLTGEDETLWEKVRLACGQRVEWVCIPGIFTRMGARRCGACCDIRGLPRGKGSPKNDDACRVLLGLPVGPGQ